MDYEEKSASTADERLDAWMEKYPALMRSRARGRAVPGWLTGILISGAFILPLVWVVGDDTPFDLALSLVTQLAGDEGPRHLASYLICALACLVPVVVFIQVYGAIRVRRQNDDTTSS